MKTNISIRILENDFHLVCDVNEKDVLAKGAELLNSHLKAFRRANPSIDSEQLLLMGALRATCELLAEADTLSEQAKTVNSEIKKVLSQLDDAKLDSK